MKNHWWKTIASFVFVLCMMPLGHAMMIIMEKTMAPGALHCAAFAMGAAGLLLAVWGVFVKGDTKQTLMGFFGGLLFWTGWVEFLFQYYANRWGTQPEIINGEVVTKPEYLILPATFGFWMMIMILYIFCTQNGCYFINWWQKVLLRSKKKLIAASPMTRHTSIVTFMEFNMIIWACYLALMFCYDRNFLGGNHPVTAIVGIGCFVGAVFMFKRQLKRSAWGANIRMAIATVIVFWTPVEILMRLKFFKEFWLEPEKYTTPMVIILVLFVALLLYICYSAYTSKRHKKA